MNIRYGDRLRQVIREREVLPFIGVYDVFSASIAARHYDALFVSGFSFAASHYGLPDIGFISWSDIVAFVQRVRTILPDHHLLVDVDDGYADPEVACHVVSLLESIGASAVVMEDQKRPRSCGHFDGRQLLELPEYLLKLKKVLSTRKNLFVIARTDASQPDDILSRVEAFAKAGADAVLVDGLRDPALLGEIRKRVDKPLVFNQIMGGKSPACTLRELTEWGVQLVIYSTPCLFAAQSALETAMQSLKENDGDLRKISPAGVTVQCCNSLLQENLLGRHRGE